MNYAVQTENLTKEYKTTIAVNDASIRVPEGCCCGFLGKNGAGKTTTLKMMVGLTRPTKGSVKIMGEPQIFGRQTPLFGYLPDVPNFYGYMTGEEFLNLCAKLCNIPPKEAKQRIKTLLQTVGLSKTRTKIAGYSRGMKQRLGIAQAMINNPKVIFMDEPMSALDPMGRHDVAEIIKNLKGTTVVFSTHILADVENVCDYILIIEKGKIVAQDTMENLKKRHAENTTKIRFYNIAEAEQFKQKAVDSGFITEPTDIAAEFLLTVPNGQMEEASRKILHLSAGMAVASFAAHTPTLENIFYKEITNV